MLRVPRELRVRAEGAGLEGSCGPLKTSPKERAGILRFLAVGPDHGGVLEPWRLRAAFKALSQGGR
jgi:hypothetical protein